MRRLGVLFVPWHLCVAEITLLFVVSCQPPAHSLEWDQYVSDFLEDHFAARPAEAVAAGRHKFDGKLPDWSAAGITREINRLHDLKERALALDVASFSEEQQFERAYLLAVIDKELFWWERAQWPFKNPLFYSGDLDPNVYISREYAPLADRMRAYVRYAKAIPNAVEEIQSNLQPLLPRTYINVGITIFAGLASYYEHDVPRVFSSVQDSQLQQEFRAANEEASTAMRSLVAWLESLRPGATRDFALGPKFFQEMLWATERVEIPLDELKRIGEQDLDRNLAALDEACNIYMPGRSITDCISQAQSVKPEDGPVAAARRQLTELKTFLIDQGLVTIPGSEEAKVAESPPYARWNFAYIDIPGPYEEGLPSTYYIAPPDPAWSEEERQAYIPGNADLLAVSVHEVWPGHFLQFLHANRALSKFGQVFVGYAFAEGWAHYSEEMMWEAGLGDGSPEVHIGQLLNALLRNIRFLSAIGLHTEGMTVEESQEMFQELAYQDAGTARQQAARGTFDPAYLNYTMGKLMIRKLRQDWTASRGGRSGWREFHDQFLSYGGPPIPLVRKDLLSSDSGSLF